MFNKKMSKDDFIRELNCFFKTNIIDEKTNFLEIGISSLQIMRLINNLSKSGVKVAFGELMEKPATLEWFQIIKSHQLNMNIEPDFNLEIPLNMPFDLTEVQQSYLVGRKNEQVLGGVGCHFYCEFKSAYLDINKLQNAWEKLLDIHPMLRAKFSMDDKQMICDTSPNREIKVYDLRDKSNKEQKMFIDEIRERLSKQVMNVNAGEVVELHVSCLNDDNSLIHFGIDLLVADLHSLRIIFRDLSDLYSERKTKYVKDNFYAYLKWKNEVSKSSKAADQKYWNQKIQLLPEYPRIPMLIEPQNLKINQIGKVKYVLSLQMWDNLKKICSTKGVSPSMFFLTCYALVLDKWSSNSSFIINMPLFNRKSDGIEVSNIVADFTDVLLVDVDCSEELTFYKQLLKIQKSFIENSKHTDYSGVNVQKDLLKERGNGELIAPVVFSCNYGEPLLTDNFIFDFGNISNIITQTPQVILDFQIIELQDGLLLTWDFSEGLFPKNMIQEMFSELIKMVHNFNKDIWDKQISTFSIPKRYLINDVSSKLLHQSLFDFSKESESRIAVIDAANGKKITYADLSNSALRIAASLVEQGVEPGDMIAIMLPRSIEQIVAIYGVLYAGAAYVPISMAQPKMRTQVMLKKANIKILITLNNAVEEYKDVVSCLDIYSCNNVKPLCEPVVIDNLYPAYAIFTSGSTGTPKAVLVSHRSAMNTILDINSKYNINRSDGIFAISNVTFDLSVYDIFGMASAGGHVVLVPQDEVFNPTAWIEYINEYKVSIWNSVPALFDMLLSTIETNKKRLSLRRVLLSGDWVSLDIPERLSRAMPKAKLTVLGGATEAAIWSNYFDVQFPIPKEWKSIPYGYPLKNQFYRIVDRKNRDCPAWVEGELWIGGVGVGEKYINDEKQTEEHFIEEASMRWYKTGDIGKFWDNGVIEFLGRKDFQVKINGHRIECGEIEAQLREMTEVSDAVVMPVSVGGGKILVAFINYIFSATNQQMCLLQNDKRIKIQSFLEERLIDYMIPINFVEVSRIPLSENGKVNRKKLLEDYMRVIGTQKYDDNTQMCDGEKRLAAIWKQVLNLENIGLEDNYFRVGGDSLVAVKLAIKVQEAFGINFKLTDIYMYPTIKSQYKKVQRAITDGCELDSEHKAVLPAIESHFDKMYEEFPLTDIQQAYWLGRKDIYSYGNITTHYYFELDCSNLDIKKAEDSFNSLIMRHPMMRAVLCENGQKQRILRNVPKYVIEIEKLSKMCDSDKNIRLMEVRENYAHKYFLPEKWPLFEIKISELSNTTQRVHICFDNIIFDGRSIFIILNEWKRIYDGRSAELKELQVLFRDYVLNLPRLRGEKVYCEDLEYWRNKLDSIYAAPELPLVNKAETSEGHFKHREITLDPSTWNNIEKIAKDKGLTLPAILLTAYAEIIGRWSKKQKFTINITRFNRLPLHEQINDIVGDFTTLTFLSIDLSNGDTFYDRCIAVQKQLWNDIGHSMVCGVEVLRQMKQSSVSRDLEVMPIVFTSSLGLDEIGNNSAEWLGKRVYSSSETPQVWIDYQILKQKSGTTIIWDSLDSIFPENLIADMFEAHAELIERIANDVNVWNSDSYSTVKINYAEQRLKANETSNEVSSLTLLEMFDRQVAQNSTNIAVITSNEQLTYEQLSARADIIVQQLLEYPKTKITAIILEKGWEQLAAIIAIYRTGEAYLPIAPDTPLERVKIILEEGKVEKIVTNKKIADNLQLVNYHVIDCSNIHKKGGANIDFKHELRPDNLAYVIYTSGSTGKPKGVMIDHRGAVNTILDINQKYGVLASDRVFSLSNLNFDLSVYDIFGILGVGGAVILPEDIDRQNPEVWIEMVEKYNVTVWNTVPAFMQMLVETLRSRNMVLNSIRLALLSGDWIPTNLPGKINTQLPNAEIVSLGGATEASIWSIYYDIREVKQWWTSIPYGKPLSNQRFYVLNDLLCDCPEFVIGELYIGGIGLALGYFNDEELTEKKFIVHPASKERIYRTGDLGYYLPDGNIQFIGREDGQIKINGYRIELGEIENALKSIPGISTAVATVVDDEGGKCIVGFATTDNSAESEIFIRRDFFHTEDNICLQDEIEEVYISEKDDDSIRNYMVLLDDICAELMMEVINKMNIFESMALTLTDILKKAAIIDGYQELFVKWIDILVQAGYLELVDGYYAPCIPKEVENKVEHATSIGQDELNKLRVRLLNHIHTYIRLFAGTTSAMDLLLDDSFILPGNLADFNILEENNMKAITKLVKVISKKGNHQITVAEIGSRISNLFPSILADIADLDTYYYLDESRTYMNKTRDMVDKNIEFIKFDTNSSLSIQDVKEYQMDVVVANNTLHRAKNVNNVLENIARILKPGGYLIFNENVDESRLMYVTAAFFENGFTKYVDNRKGKTTPIMKETDWRMQLEKAGFEDIRIVSFNALKNGRQAIFIARTSLYQYEMDQERVKNYIRQRLPEYMMPRSVIHIEKVPLSGNGKVSHKELSQLYFRMHEKKADNIYEKPEDGLENEIAKIWKSILKQEKIGANDSFFLRGGDSLKAILCVNELKNIGIQISLRELYELQTIRKIAALKQDVNKEEDFMVGEI